MLNPLEKEPEKKVSPWNIWNDLSFESKNEKANAM